MTAGWLDTAMEQVFGDDAPACVMCGDERELRMVAFAGDLQDVIIPCPFHRPQPFVVVPWRSDQPTSPTASTWTGDR